MWRALGDWSTCFEVDVRFVVVAWGIGADLEVESLFEEGQVWCLMVCAGWRRRVGIVVDARAEVVVVVAAAAAAVVRQRRRMEQVHCVEEGSRGVKMAVVGIVVL